MAGRTVVTIPWYLREDYAQDKAMFGDLPETYEVWLDRALQWEEDCQMQGQADHKTRTDFISRKAWTLMQR